MFFWSSTCTGVDVPSCDVVIRLGLSCDMPKLSAASESAACSTWWLFNLKQPEPSTLWGPYKFHIGFHIGNLQRSRFWLVKEDEEGAV